MAISQRSFSVQLRQGYVGETRRPVRLRVRTPPFHGGDTSSNLVRATENTISTAWYTTNPRKILISGDFVFTTPVLKRFYPFLVFEKFIRVL